MAVFWITFRISEKTLHGKDYETRYMALVDAVHNATVGNLYWQDPTSFLAFESDQTIQTLASKFKSEIAPSHDLFLIRRMDVKDALICGNVEDEDIFELMPYLKKL